MTFQMVDIICPKQHHVLTTNYISKIAYCLANQRVPFCRSHLIWECLRHSSSKALHPSLIKGLHSVWFKVSCSQCCKSVCNMFRLPIKGLLRLVADTFLSSVLCRKAVWELCYPPSSKHVLPNCIWLRIIIASILLHSDLWRTTNWC